MFLSQHLPSQPAVILQAGLASTVLAGGSAGGGSSEATVAATATAASTAAELSEREPSAAACARAVPSSIQETTGPGAGAAHATAHAHGGVEAAAGRVKAEPGVWLQYGSAAVAGMASDDIDPIIISDSDSGSDSGSDDDEEEDGDEACPEAAPGPMQVDSLASEAAAQGTGGAGPDRQRMEGVEVGNKQQPGSLGAHLPVFNNHGEPHAHPDDPGDGAAHGSGAEVQAGPGAQAPGGTAAPPPAPPTAKGRKRGRQMGNTPASRQGLPAHIRNAAIQELFGPAGLQPEFRACVDVELELDGAVQAVGTGEGAGAG